MTLEELIRRFRVDATDAMVPYLFQDEWIIDWLNDAQEEAAIRGRLLYEADNTAITRIAASASVTGYALHPSLYELVEHRYRVGGDTRSETLLLTTREELSRTRPDWRNDADGTPRYLVQDDTRISLWPTPDKDGAVLLEGYRLPIKRMENDSDKPEINPAHHRHLVQWALHQAFSLPDAETVDPVRAAMAEKEFTRYFGLRPDSDLRRATRGDEVQTNKVFWV